MLKGGVIMDVTTAAEARIAEEAGLLIVLIPIKLADNESVDQLATCRQACELSALF